MLLVHGLPDKYNATTQIAMTFGKVHQFSVAVCLIKEEAGCTPIFVILPSLMGTQIPLQAWTGPEGSRRLRLPDFKTIGT